MKKFKNKSSNTIENKVTIGVYFYNWIKKMYWLSNIGYISTGDTTQSRIENKWIAQFANVLHNFLLVSNCQRKGYSQRFDLPETQILFGDSIVCTMHFYFRI